MKDFQRLSVFVSAFFCGISAYAVDAYDTSTNLLTLESVSVGGQTYKNVAVTMSGYSQLSLIGGSPGADVFDPTTSLLKMGAVAVGGVTYTNVQVHADRYSLLSVNGATTADTQSVSNYSGILASYLSTLNTYRTQCGLPAVVQNTRLDSATTSYSAIGGRVQGVASASNYSQPSTVGFVASDYISNSSDMIAIGRSQVLLAMTEPYALLSLMRPYSEIGMSVTSNIKNGQSNRTASVMLGNLQSRGLSSPLTFPCANTMDIPPRVPSSSVGGVSTIGTPAIATPFTGWYTTNAPMSNTGTPIVVFAQPGDSLVIRSASISTGGVAVPFIQWDSTRSVGVTTGGFYPASDKLLYSYEGVVLPLAALAENTVYDVTVSGTVNGVLFSKAFKFKTGVGVL